MPAEVSLEIHEVPKMFPPQKPIQKWYHFLTQSWDFSREKKNDFIDVFGRFLHALLEEKLVYKNEFIIHLQGLLQAEKMIYES